MINPTQAHPPRHPSPIAPTHATRRWSILAPCLLVATLGLAGCVLAPEGARDARASMESEGKRFETPFEHRALTELPEKPTWRQVLQRGLLTSGELEASFHDWKASVERIDIASTWPNSNVELGFSAMFSNERMKTFDRLSLTAGFDPAMSLAVPAKSHRAGKVALSDARAAGEHFRFVKFDVQKRLLMLWAEFTFQQRKIEIARELLSLDHVAAETAAVRVRAGESQAELLTAQLSERERERALADLLAEHESTRARLNAQLARDPKAPLEPPGEPEPARTLPADDELMLLAAADIYPEVGRFMHEVDSRREALELARLRWIPDVNPMVGLTGTASQMVGASVMLPTMIPAIRAGIRESEAQLHAAEARLRQMKADRLGEYVGLLVTYRASERRIAWLEQQILPPLRDLADAEARSYALGNGSFSGIINARRMILETQESLAMSRMIMDKTLADIECCLGVDVETISPTGASEHASAGSPHTMERNSDDR